MFTRGEGLESICCNSFLAAAASYIAGYRVSTALPQITYIALSL